MNKQYHILNGDHLKSIFPSELAGEKYVLRECLVDGPVNAKEPSSFYEQRATFISEEYKNIVPDQYFSFTVSEFEKIEAIPEGSEVTLWFEEDLFCQINFWFACSLLEKSGKSFDLYLVTPPEESKYSFGNETSALLEMYQNRVVLSSENCSLFSELWKKFKNDTEIKRDKATASLLEQFSFLPTVFESITMLKSGKLQQGANALKDAMKDDSFESIFRAFTSQYPQFGFGDLQVKRLLGGV